ncbi:phospholipase D-like domain-containing protein [Francisella frigiditurris]|uniref:Phospholipase D family protein n=1 Tax=Francisella frigiditurris TaxID=1542390 RepID=A0A1J0KV29_9GAMM|nr:phospholipase D-like domain-containing protein [Francisella frigiditurris]APC97672.1 phospholipase D family protein [Francisella frigiditurris]
MLLKYFLIYLLIGLTVISILYKRSFLRAQLFWIAVVCLAPNISGVIIYWLAQLKKRGQQDCFPIALLSTKNREALSTPLTNLMTYYQLSALPYSKTEFFYETKDIYQCFVDQIHTAKESIFLVTYIWDLDTIGNKLMHLLEDKAKKGVQVKIIVDAFGSNVTFSLKKNLQIRKLRKKGIDIVVFNSLFGSLLFRNHYNPRNHRKIYIFDNITTLIGGVNISGNYLAKGKNSWKDVILKIEGDITKGYTNLFVSDWNYASKNSLEFCYEGFYLEKNPQKSAYIIPSGPDIQSEIFYNTLISLLATAKNKITIITPYFILSDQIFSLIKNAALRGVNITIIIPFKSDGLIATLLNYNYVRDLEKYNINYFLYTKSMLHSKLILVDNEVVLIGSANLDYRSLFINYEISTLFHEEKLIKNINNFAEDLKKDSIRELPKKNLISLIPEKLLKLIAPLS